MSNQKAIAAAADILDKAKVDIKDVLNHPDNSMILLGIGTGLDQLTNRLRHLSGTTAKNTAAAADQFPPVTSFMGKPINRVGDVKAEDLTPDDADRQAFVAKVEKLYSEFGDMSPNTILNSYRNEPMVIRGVAKRAGVRDYKDREITVTFLDEIAITILDKEEQEYSQKQRESQVATDKRIGEIKELLECIPTDVEIFLTEKITAEAELAKKPTDKALQKKVKDVLALIEHADKRKAELEQELANLES